MSSQADPPRRSSRRPKPKKYSSHSVGDVVEIARNNVIATGRLVYKLSEGPTANPRWLVTFDKETWKDEELYERSFGKVLEKVPDDSDPNSTDGQTTTSTTTITATTGVKSQRKSKSAIPVAVATGGGGGGPASSKLKLKLKSKKGVAVAVAVATAVTDTTATALASGTSGSDEDGGRKRKIAAFSEESSLDNNHSPLGEGDDSPKGDNARASSREQRSLRRQAIIHEEVPGGALHLDSVGSSSSSSMAHSLLPRTTAAASMYTTTATGSNKNKREAGGLEVLVKGGSNGKNESSSNSNNSGGVESNKRSRKDEEIVKIPMFTGTLYLYRGLNRRATFVRRV